MTRSMTHSAKTRERWVLAFILLAALPCIALGGDSVPRLEVDMEKAVTLDFTDATVRKIYEALGEATGIQFVFNDKVDLEKQTSLSLSNIPLRETLGLVTDKFRTFHVVHGPRTVFVAPDVREMRLTYEPQAIQAFHLSHLDTRGTVTLLRSILQARQIAEIPNQNAVVLRDSAANVEIAGRMIEALDHEGGEVLLDLELIEISSAELQGITEHSSSSASTSAATAERRGAEPSGGNQGELARRIRSSTGSERIAGPQLRVVAGRRGSIFVGERVALPSAALDSSESEQETPAGDATAQQDLGIRIEVVPTVHEDGNVTLNLAFEMSSLSLEESPGSQMARQPVVARRTVETTMRLEDGGTQVLTGLALLKADGADLSPTETELVLLVTAHVSRMPDVRPTDRLPLWIGTEAD